MNILCRLGWHRWKPVVRLYRSGGRAFSGLVVLPNGVMRRVPGKWFGIGHKCRRCGVRK